MMTVLRVSVTRPPLISMIHVLQAIGAPQYWQSVVRLFVCNQTFSHKRLLGSTLHLIITFYGFFNLEFFRHTTNWICLNLDVKQMQVLEYAAAFLPLLLIVVAYLLIKLHVRGFKPVVWFWKPFHYCLNYCQREWYLKSSLVETFASFLLLSWMKLLSISLRLLNTVCVFTVSSDGNISKDCSHLLNFPNLRLFDGEHLLVGIIAIIVLVLFVFVPLLLLILYPFRSFHWILNWCGYHSQALHVFMDSFQGSFGNGTDGTTDCRWFASIYLIMRIFLILLAAVFKSRYYFPVASITLIGLAFTVYILQKIHPQYIIECSYFHSGSLLHLPWSCYCF